MIGKPEWFKRRKYGGWGLTPRTWQGWAYTAALACAAFAASALFKPGSAEFWGYVYVLTAFAALDVGSILLGMKKDEREAAHEAVAERNAAWVMVLVITIALIYQVSTSASSGAYAGVDPFLVLALFAGVLVKAFTNYKLDREN